MAGTNSRLLPTIVNNFFSSSGFRNAVGLFITKQQAENLAKEEAERVFCTLNESEKESIRNALPKQELTVVKLLSAALELLTEYNQPYFTSNLSKANATCKEYTDISLRVAITLDPGHPIIRRKNSNQSNNVACNTYGCQRIADFHLAINQTALKWVQILLEVLYQNEQFVTSYFDSRSKRVMLNRDRADLQRDMNQPQHPLYDQYVRCLALFNKVNAAASGFLSLACSLSIALLPPLPPPPLRN